MSNRQRFEKILKLLSEILEDALEDAKPHAELKLKKETITKRNYDKFKLIIPTAGTERVYNKRLLAKALFDYVISLKPKSGYSLQELKETLPIGNRLFIERDRAKERNKLDRYFEDVYVTREGKEILFYNQWGPNIKNLIDYANATFDVQIEKVA